MKYLIFSKLNRNHFLFLTYFIVITINNIVNKYIYFGKDLIFTFNNNYIFTLSDFLTLIPVIIIRIRSKSVSKEKEESSKKSASKNESNNDIKYIYTDKNKKRRKRILNIFIKNLFI